ncbi:MAG: PilZ domain-containing protein [Blastocatellia bacterium]|nr:PilZ domain-containing protein [Blastocatellia bacterium]
MSLPATTYPAFNFPNTNFNASNSSNINATNNTISNIDSLTSSQSNIFNTRLTKRVALAITLFIRRPINSKSYNYQVSTINISRYGALISSNLPLEIGAELEVSRAITDFSAKAIVRHIRKDPKTNKYLIGLDFQQTRGKWLIL